MFLRVLSRKIIPVSYQFSRASGLINSLQYSQRNFCNCDQFLSSSFSQKHLIRLYSNATAEQLVVVDFDEVNKAIEDKNILIIDVRDPDEIKERGKIPKSINIPVGNVSSVLTSMSDKEFKDVFHRSKPTKDTQIIFYCKIGRRSGMAQRDAINLGFKNVKNYLGSWTDWASKTK